MKKRISISFFVTLLFLAASVSISAMFVDNQQNHPKTDVIATCDEATTKIEEMRGLWVSFISLDMSGTDRSFDAFKNKVSDILSAAEEMKCNTIIVQVRPFCDALYESEIFPHSHILSGKQGESAGYDALQYMCDEVHSRGMYIHAWINPYRVKSSDIPNSLHTRNPYINNTEMGVELESGIYLNPASKAARRLVTDGVKEIVENYDVDGIQFDDYFYPTDSEDFDTQDYNAYLKSIRNINNAMSKEEWRQNNVNLLIADVYKTIKELDNNVLFGISPQGNIENNYRMGADVKKWSAIAGYIDYICPQMYYSVDNPGYEFEKSLQEWSEFSYHSNIKVYIGLGAYKAGTDADSGTWQNRNDILATELMLLRRYGFDGYMIYDYSALKSDSAQKELEAFRSII